MDRLHVELDLRLQHRHADGAWGEFKPVEPHSPAEVDPERGWANSRLYACTSCDEKVRVTPGGDEPPVD